MIIKHKRKTLQFKTRIIRYHNFTKKKKKLDLKHHEVTSSIMFSHKAEFELVLEDSIVAFKPNIVLDKDIKWYKETFNNEIFKNLKAN